MNQAFLIKEVAAVPVAVAVGAAVAADATTASAAEAAQLVAAAIFAIKITAGCTSPCLPTAGYRLKG